MVRIRLKYVTADVDRHGNVRYYFRKRGLKRKTRLPGKPGDAEFTACYDACLNGQPVPETKAIHGKITPVTDRKSFAWLCQQYLASPFFRGLDEKTWRPRVSILNHICDLPISETNRTKIGEAPFADMHSKAIRRIRDRKADTPEAANNWLKALKALFKWAVEEEHAVHNPAKDVPKIKVATEGFHTWTTEEVAQWERFYPVGTKQRLALALLLFTGCRRADVVAFGPQHIKNGWLKYTQDKNENINPVTLELPILPELAEIIAATSIGHLNYIVSEYGSPYTIEGFGKRFRKWAAAAGLPHCTPHGLRKAGAVRAAENGATANELMAIFGWRDIKQAERYTRAVAQKTLAGKAMQKIGRTDKSSTNVSHFEHRSDTGGIQREKIMKNQG